MPFEDRHRDCEEHRSEQEHEVLELEARELHELLEPQLEVETLQ